MLHVLTSIVNYSTQIKILSEKNNDISYLQNEMSVFFNKKM